MTEPQLMGLGTAIGVGARHVIGWLFGGAFGFPRGALLANAVGPLLLVVGIHLGWRSVLSSEPRVALATGMLGGFMLLATFNREMVDLIQSGTRRTFLVLMLAAAVGCIVAGGLGLAMSRAMN